MILLLALAAAPLAARYPAQDNPLFSPLHRDDPQLHIGPLCDVMDSHRRVLLSFGEDVEVGAAMRIGGRLVQFRWEGSEPNVEVRFRAAEGRLILEFGREVGHSLRSSASRGTLTFIDRQGRHHRASVRSDCSD